MTFRVVPAYAALLALFFVALSINVIRARQSHRVALGTAGNADLERKVRMHANFAEYVPLALLLLAIADSRGAPAPLLHLLGIALLIGRLAHAWGLSQAVEDSRFRVGGMGTTLTMIVVTALMLFIV